MSLVDFFTNDSLFADFDRILDDAFTYGIWGTPPQAQSVVGAIQLLRHQRLDVREDKEKSLVSAMFELPGVNKESLSVGVHNSLLAVPGESRSDFGSTENTHLLRERRFGPFSRLATVSEGIKPKEAKASMENRILTATYPRHAPEHISKKIAVS